MSRGSALDLGRGVKRGWALIGLLVGGVLAVAPSLAQATTLPGTISSNQTWDAAGSPYVANDWVTIPSGVTVTVDPGAVIKLERSVKLIVDGTLDVEGTSSNPVTFTSLRDDSISGDTNGDGTATSPAQQDWRGIVFDSGGGGEIHHANINYTGWFGFAGIQAQSGSSLTAITDSEIDHGYQAISLPPGNTTSISGNTLAHNGAGIYTAGGSPEIADNTISDCASLESPSSLLGSGYGISYYGGSGDVNIHDNTVDGCGAPTSDDPSPSSFAAISVYGGPSYYGNSVTGVSLSGNTVENGGRPIDYYVDPYSSSIPADIDENTLSGNDANAIWVAGNVADSSTWEDHGFVMVIRGGYNLRVDTGATLTLGAGLVTKVTAGGGNIDVRGGFDATGSAGNPVTITSIKDDSVGGDTNANGSANSPAPNDWSKIFLNGVDGSWPVTSTLDHVDLSYATTGIDATFNANCSCTRTFSLDHSKIRNNGTGLNVAAAMGSAAATHSTFSGNSTGLYISSGTPDVSWNVIHGNTTGVQYTGGTPLTVPDDNFGGAGGPGPMGTGDAISGNLITAPLWDPFSDPCLGLGPNCPYGEDPVNLVSGGLDYHHTDLALTNKSREPLECVGPTTHLTRPTLASGRGGHSEA